MRWASDLGLDPAECVKTVYRYPHEGIDVLAEVAGDPTGLADLGYEGAADIVCVPIKKAKSAEPTDDRQTYNKLIRGIRGIGERADALLIMRLRPYAGSVPTPGGSARSPPPPASCSTTRATARCEITQRNRLLPIKAQ
ncbi:hypothetical protein HDA32_000021 [Spinactinospora alkalitolerans]|uniref:Uncharacterized protein n=1 Tax=Spinactinospora alkalitolerans TaxID=687207 RepID=A0A852TNA1_9ACTN|nr:hypothetical protein [Spinactinospora alkalitolerans]